MTNIREWLDRERLAEIGRDRAIYTSASNSTNTLAAQKHALLRLYDASQERSKQNNLVVETASDTKSIRKWQKNALIFPFLAALSAAIFLIYIKVAEHRSYFQIHSHLQLIENSGNTTQTDLEVKTPLGTEATPDSQSNVDALSNRTGHSILSPFNIYQHSNEGDRIVESNAIAQINNHYTQTQDQLAKFSDAQIEMEKTILTILRNLYIHLNQSAENLQRVNEANLSIVNNLFPLSPDRCLKESPCVLIKIVNQPSCHITDYKNLSSMETSVNKAIIFSKLHPQIPFTVSFKAGYDNYESNCASPHLSGHHLALERATRLQDAFTMRLKKILHKKYEEVSPLITFEAPPVYGEYLCDDHTLRKECNDNQRYASIELLIHEQ